MADVCDLVDDGVNAYIDSGQSITTTVVSTAEAVVELSALIAQAAIAQATASVSYVQIAGRLTVSAATAAVTIADHVTARNLVSVGARLADALLPYRSNTVNVAVTATDSRQHRLAQAVADTATGASAVSQPADLQNLIATGVQSTDTFLQALAETVAKSATVTTSLSQVLRASDLASNAATLQSAVSAGLLVVALIEVEATAAAARVDVLDAMNVVNADAFGAGEIVVDTAAAWTALAETWAMSRWADVPATALGSIDGALLAGGDGLFALDGTDDDGSQFLARLDHGVEELRSPQLKRLSYAYLSGQARGAITVQVGDHDDGREVLWDYPMERETSSVREPMRAKLGRGHRSRFFRFAVQSRTPFEVAELLIISDATSRKV